MPPKPLPTEADWWRTLTRDERKEAFLTRMRVGARPSHLYELFSVHENTLIVWRQKDPDFRAAWFDAKAQGRKARAATSNLDNLYDPEAHRDVERPDLRTFRRDFIGRPTPWHLGLVVDAWEDHTNKTVIALLPPGAGKDTLAGDIVLSETVDRSNKVSWVMESANFSTRRLSRMEGYYHDPRAYVKPKGPGCVEPTRKMYEEFGPFKWDKEMRYPDGSQPEQPKWTQNEIYFLDRENEADPNLWATGMQGAMYGSRIDTLVVSDPFTEENQRSPTVRDSQISWIIGTLFSRLDDRGRALFLGTRVGEYDNWGRLIEELVGTSPVLASSQWVTRYANGICVVQVPAIGTNEHGEETSYWPERFTLRNYLTPNASLPPSEDDDKVWVDEISEDEYLEYGTKGYALIQGLYGIRGDSEASQRWFNTAYQQRPPASEEGEFPLGLLDGCDDFEATYGQWNPGDTLVLGVDPARTGGAAWVLWAWDGHHQRVVDYFFGINIGVTGLREKLLVDPITRFRPRYAIYESNRETSVLEHPQVMDAVKGAKTEIRGVPTTHMNRGVGELRVAAMAFDMANGMIRWPAATTDDRRRSDQLKEHFLNWDQRERIRRIDNQIKQTIPDDLAMAAWVGWVKMKQIIETGQRNAGMPTRRVASSVARSWGGRVMMPSQTPRVTDPQVDLVDLYYGKD